MNHARRLAASAFFNSLLVGDEELLRSATLVRLELGAARAKVEQDINKRDVLRHLGKAQKEIDLIVEAIAQRSGTLPPS